jgi:hypothetical protein
MPDAGTLVEIFRTSFNLKSILIEHVDHLLYPDPLIVKRYGYCMTKVVSLYSSYPFSFPEDIPYPLRCTGSVACRDG